MKNYIKLAWRSIWRNKRRTLITAASIFFAVFFALVMRAFQLGSYSHWTNNVVETYTGYLQIQAKGYFEDKSIDNSYEFTEEINQALRSDKNIRTYAPRLEYGALASYGNQTRATIIIGIDPIKEDAFSKVSEKLVQYKITEATLKAFDNNVQDSILSKKMRELLNTSFSHEAKMKFEIQYAIGEEATNSYFEIIKKNSHFTNNYFTEKDNGVLIADRLSKFLGIGVGDTLVLTGIGYHGITAEGIYPIRGIVKIPSPDLDKALVYMPLESSELLFSAENRITSVAITLFKTSDYYINQTDKELQEKIGPNYEVYNWKKLNELMMNQIKADSDQGILMIGLLYVIIAFGIFGTVLMMTQERKREFGVMIAIGMRKYKLAAIVTLEMVFIGIVGIISGILAALPIVFYFNIHPVRLGGEVAASIEAYGMEAVMPMEFTAGLFLNQAGIVILLVVVAAFYPIYSITKIKVIKALKA